MSGVDKDKYNNIDDKLPSITEILTNHGEGDYATLHQNAEKPGSWFWENMNHGFGTPGARIFHREFSTLTEGVHPGYEAVVFCVICANSAAPYLPKFETTAQ
jgi:hypothetical protein